MCNDNFITLDSYMGIDPGELNFVDVQMSFAQRTITIDDVRQIILDARQHLKEGRLGPTRTKRVISLHSGLLLLRGLDLGEGLADDDTFVEQNWVNDDETQELIKEQEPYADHMRKLAEQQDNEAAEISVNCLKTEIPSGHEEVVVMKDADVDVMHNQQQKLIEQSSNPLNLLQTLQHKQMLQKQLQCLLQSQSTQLNLKEQIQQLAKRNALAEQQELRKRDIDKFQIVQFFKKHPDIDATQAADVFKSYQLDSGILNALKNQGKRLSTEFIQSKALGLARELGCGNFNVNWIARFIATHAHKLAKPGQAPRRSGQDKRKSFVRLTFGEKHEISCFIIKNPKWPVRAYAEHFTKLWDRNVTQKQIEVTKENKQKWSDPQYKNVSQSYEKFQRKSSIRLSRTEREEIAKYIQLNTNMTLEETARYFSRIWGKDVNRTHIARIKNHARAAQDHLDDDYEYTQVAGHRQVGEVTMGTGAPPNTTTVAPTTNTSTIPQQFMRSPIQHANQRPDRPQAPIAMGNPSPVVPPPPPPQLQLPQHKHPLFNTFMIPPQFKFQKDCYNNNHEEALIRSNHFHANYDYQLHLQKQQHQQQQQQQQQQQHQAQLEDGDSGISVGSSISPTSAIADNSHNNVRSSVIMSTKSVLNRLTQPTVKKETIEVSSVQSMDANGDAFDKAKIFNCPQCEWQSYDKAKFWEHITSNHFKNMVLPKLATLQDGDAKQPNNDDNDDAKTADEELDVIDIKTQPLESDDIIMMT